MREARNEFARWLKEEWQYPAPAYLDQMADKAAEIFATPAPPEVIEGKGQVVTEEQCGYYWREGRSGQAITVVALSYADAKFVDGCRYIAAVQPTFPPRPTFTAPEKPELVLCRFKGTGNVAWAAKVDDKLHYGCQFFKVSEVEILNPATGEPLATN